MKDPKNKLTHLLVDLDGTLVQGDGFRMRMAFVAQLVQRWHDLGGRVKVLKAIRRMNRAIEGSPNGLTNEVKMVRAFAQVYLMKEDEARILLEKTLLEIFPKLDSYFGPIPGAKTFIDWAKSRYTLILATNPVWIPKCVEWRVLWAGLDPSDFYSFTHAGRMHSCKPRLEYYRELLDQEGLSPEQCMLIGNEKENDLPARHAGIPVFLVNKNPGEPKAIYESIMQKQGVSASAQAWTGTYLGLQKFLEGN